jgi:hypothetical protein
VRDRSESGESKAPLPSEDVLDFVPIVGVVHHVTALGVFLDVGDRRVFVGRNCMEPARQPLAAGEPATLRVEHWFATQEGLK